MSFIEGQDLVKIYGHGDSAVSAIADMSFGIESGEFVAVMGESGSGKSTLLSVLGAMNVPTRGRLRVDDIDIYSLSAERRADFRREFLGFVFQSFHLVAYLTVIENVLLPLAIVDFDTAARIWGALAASGDPRAQFHFGALMYEGRTVEPDLVMAYVWLSRAVDGGYLPAIDLRRQVRAAMSEAQYQEALAIQSSS